MSTNDGKRTPILISGCPRSGTTFLGSVFEASKDCFEIYEPFNSDFTYHLDLPTRFYRITPEETPRYRRQVDRLIELSSLSGRLKKLPRGMMDRMRAEKDVPSALALKKCVQNNKRFVSARRVVFKDPIAFFSASWLAETYDADVVLMLRHPGGVISSYLALDWQAETPELIDHMMPETREKLEAEITQWRATPGDRIGELILQWKIFTIETIALSNANPDWHVVSHEYLCDHPEEVFSTLFRAFGLDYSEQVRAKIAESTGANNIVDPKKHTQHNLNRQSKTLKDSWKKRLDDEVLKRIATEAEPLWEKALCEIKQASLLPTD